MSRELVNHTTIGGTVDANRARSGRIGCYVALNYIQHTRTQPVYPVCPTRVVLYIPQPLPYLLQEKNMPVKLSMKSIKLHYHRAHAPSPKCKSTLFLWWCIRKACPVSPPCATMVDVTVASLTAGTAFVYR